MNNFFFVLSQFLAQKSVICVSRQMQPVVPRISETKFVLQTQIHSVQLTVAAGWGNFGTAKEMWRTAFFEDASTVQVGKRLKDKKVEIGLNVQRCSRLGSFLQQVIISQFKLLFLSIPYEQNEIGRMVEVLVPISTIC